ncbi:MAG: biotin transporter BioY [candidate division KSB1 bacterium]|nr:biotin transporter BioY [candidate division KSB1 bacterium]MDZ7274857.1 biotin transporter BioY [candidate division KSB1 bacterium]MDZ7288224.1 biotin transporter BioY [candidate division KSB1 bacterium]MDZ7300395.1 biotin transporter BioY [candidate division KSB1 bacterium]MDZ7308770.1 biotin transporter BioY [candidate division KSB1 bacterium]
MPLTPTTGNRRERLRAMILTSLFTALTAFGAFLRIPLPLVPLSLQDFFVLLSGSLLGPVFGCLSQLLYLGLGLAGLPVFTQGGGPAYVLQPTFGYLLGFPPASFLTGILIHGRSGGGRQLPALPLPRLLLAYAAGMAAIFTLGIGYLWLNARFVLGSGLTLTQALWTGGLIFLPGSLVKLGALSMLYRLLQTRLTVAPPHL